MKLRPAFVRTDPCLTCNNDVTVILIKCFIDLCILLLHNENVTHFGIFSENACELLDIMVPVVMKGEWDLEEITQRVVAVVVAVVVIAFIDDLILVDDSLGLRPWFSPCFVINI